MTWPVTVATFAGSTTGADAAEAGSEGVLEQAAAHDVAIKKARNFTIRQL
jgi:hypothetical protein